MTTDLTIRDDDRALRTFYGTDDPDQMLAAASKKAAVLAKVVENQQLYTTIGKKRHVHIEGWTFLGSQVGVFPVPVWSRKTETGWEARVEARTMDGAIVGAAEAQCDRDEEGWADKPDYALRSMAQTRAASKALRLPLGYIMVLAGFEATPAEEMIEGKARVVSDQATRGSVSPREHWCDEHNTAFFKRGKMKAYAHPMGEGEPWCYEKENKPRTEDTPRPLEGRELLRTPEGDAPPSRVGALMGKRDEFAQAYADAWGWDLQKPMTTAQRDDLALAMRIWIGMTFQRNDPDAPKRNDPDAAYELSFDSLSPEEQDIAIGMLKAQTRGEQQKKEREAEQKEVF